MSPKSTRISFELPVVPYALRAFIEKAVTDDRTRMSFVESPGNALRAAGVPMQVEDLTKDDTDRLLGVIGNLRALIENDKIASDFRFEDVFKIASQDGYQEQRSSSEAYAETNFDHSQEGHSAENKSSSEGGIKDNFSKAGLGRRIDDISAPLISPGDLASITALMQANTRVMLEEG